MGYGMTGYKEVSAALKALPKAMNDKVWSDINFVQSKLVVDRMKLNAPEGPTGNLVDSIGAVRMKRERLGTVWVGPRRKGGKRGFAGHLVEYGTKDRKTRKGTFRGRMSKNPFAYRTWTQVSGQLENGIAKSAQRVLTSTIKKYV